MRLIGIHGLKGSGKTSTANSIIERYHELDEEIVVVIESFAKYVKFIATRIMGIDADIIYGDDEEKNGLTQYRWENMPFYGSLLLKKMEEIASTTSQYDFFSLQEEARKLIPVGFMTGRQILQTLGTEIFRCMDNDVWTKAMSQKIHDFHNREEVVVVIDDVRFDNEIECIHELGGRVYSLTRGRKAADTHISENGITHFERIDKVIDNTQLTIEETAQAIIDDCHLHQK